MTSLVYYSIFSSNLKNQTNFFKNLETNPGRIKGKQGAKSRGRPRIRPPKSFGGSYFKNYNPREQRPINQNQALHLVLKSSQATGVRSFKNKKFEKKIWQIIKKHAQKNSIKIYEYANAGNHLHLLIRVKRRDFYNKFIRTITGLIARLVKSIENGAPIVKSFWDSRPYSRIVGFRGREFKMVKLYLARNTFEAIGFILKIKRSKKLNSEWKEFWYRLVSVPG